MVELFCDVQNLGSLVLLWKRGARVLYAGTVKVRRDNRIERKGTNLVITNLTKADAGSYDCEVEIDRTVAVSIQHWLDIHVPPSDCLGLCSDKHALLLGWPNVTSDASSGTVRVEQGSTVTIQCSASGNPQPHVYWFRQHINKTLGTNGKLSFVNVSKDDAGLYSCTADNGIGLPAIVDTNLQVLYKPIVRVSSSVVHGGLGLQAVLSCVVEAEPPPKIRWYRGTMLIETDNHRYMKRIGTKYNLIIMKLTQQDFSTFKCSAGNSLGTAEARITLTGIPNPPKILERIQQEGNGSYRLKWTVDSYTPIDSYTVTYRKVLDFRDPSMIYPWTTIHLPPGPTKKEKHAENGGNSQHNHKSADHLRSSDGQPYVVGVSRPLNHTAHFVITHIEDRAEYEVQVIATNQFGSSDPSDVFRFHTSTVETMPVESLRKEVQDVTSNGKYFIYPTQLLYLVNICIYYYTVL